MPKEKVMLIGAGGQLGFDLLRSVPERFEVVPLRRKDLDVCNHAAVAAAIGEARPAHVIDLAAFHRTDVCEDDVPTTFAVNCHAVKQLAQVCDRNGACLTFVSTDYVFSGQDRTPRVETDATAPCNVYGISKRAGESMVQTYAPSHYLFRVSGLYGVAGSSGKGSNFVETMIRLAREGKPIRVVTDQVLTPTSTRDASEKIWEVLGQGPHGLYHCTNSGECSWYDFTMEIFRQMELTPSLSPQSTVQAGAKAPRPQYSVLDNKGLRDAGFDDLRPWQEALNMYLVEKHAASSLA